MTGSVDNIIESGHDVEVAVLVEVACVTRCVVTRGLFHILLEETLIVVKKSVHEGRWHR